MLHKIIISIILIFGGCDSKISTSTSLSENEYKVYSTIINNHFNYKVFAEKESSLYNPLYVLDKTSAFDVIDKGLSLNNYLNESKVFPVDTLKSLSKSGEWDILVSNFSKILKDSIVLDSSKLNIPFKYFLFPASIKNIDKTYFIGFSRVGFNKSHNEALVYFYLMEYEGGGEFVVLLNKTKNEWQVVNGYGVRHDLGSRYGYYHLFVP